MNTTWSRPTKYIVGVGLVLMGIFILNLSRAVIPLLVVAALIAVIVRPVILWLHLRVHLHRGLAVGLVYLGLAILAPLAVMLILPTITDALAYVGNLDYQSILKSSAEWLRSTLIMIKAARLPVAGLNAYVDRAVDTLLKAFQPFSPTVAVPPSFDAILQPLSSALRSVVETGANLVGAVTSQAVKIGFIFLASIYISLEAHTYRSAFLQTAPAVYRPEISVLLDRIERVWNAFFRGELILMLVVGVMTTIGLAALGMPGALYLGIIAGLLEIIPNFGPFIAVVPAVIVALIQGSVSLPINHLFFAVLIILFYILVQQVENNLIVPRVLGTALELSPLIVMTGIVIGVSVSGIMGALLATPVIATGREVLHYIDSKMQEQGPIQVEGAAPESGIPPSEN
ncbi:MAG: AI-2E family transporter [Anaerolineales bacterium]|nr:AI-2E family transporter [Anaerolineales bacterium]